MKNSALQKVSKMTTITTSTLNKLASKIVLAIADSVEDSIKKEEELSDIDIGIGTLVVKHNSNEIEYRFIPSDNLEQAIKDTVINGKSLLTAEMEKTLVDKLTKTYKELM